MRTLRITGMLIILLLASMSMEAQQCTRYELHEPPSWVSTATYDSANGVLLIADPKMNELLRLSPVKSELSRHVFANGFKVSTVTNFGDGFIVKSREGARLLDADLKEVGSFNFKQNAEKNSTGLGSLYSNWAALEGTFLGYGSAVGAGIDPTRGDRDPGRGFELGFVTGTLDLEGGSVRDVKLLEATDDNEFYLLGNQYFASNNKGIFFVRMIGGYASVATLVADARQPIQSLASFPKGYASIPKTGDRGFGIPTFAEYFEQLESVTMPVGLFGSVDDLFLVTRERGGLPGSTKWLVHSIPLDSAEPIVSYTLPTAAKHITFASSDENLYLIERGHVRSWGEQSIKSVVEVPLKWLRSGDSSPIFVGRSKLIRCKSLKTRAPSSNG